MNDLLIHPITEAAIRKTIQESTHALLLAGPTGSGKLALAQSLVANMLELDSPASLLNYPYFRHIAPTNQAISIDDVRELQRFLQFKTTGRKELRRAVIIENAHLMTIEAQNALLKSLEEPPVDTIIILTAIASLKLKPTVYSRVQRIDVLPIGSAEAQEYFSARGAEKPSIDKAYTISGGNSGLMSAILRQVNDHELFRQLEAVKKLLSSPIFERLIQIDELAKQREQLPLFLYASRLVCKSALSSAAAKKNQKLLKHWTKCLKAIYQAEAALSHNPNTKLLLTNLFLTV